MAPRHVLSPSALEDAESTTLDAARSGHWQYAPLALIADLLASPPIPGAGWMRSTRWPDGAYFTEPVLVFTDDRAVAPDGNGCLVAESAEVGVLVWHPAQYLNGEQMTRERAEAMLAEPLSGRVA